MPVVSALNKITIVCSKQALMKNYVPEYQFASLSPAHSLANLACNIGLFEPDKKSIITVLLFEYNEVF
jgi:hypothetical protein